MRMTLKQSALLLALLSMMSPASAQSPGRPKHASFDKASHQKAKAEHGGKEAGGEYWFSRGYELHQSDRYQQAIEAFAHSIDMGYRQATAMYNIACGFALLNDKENALTWLERSLAIGFDGADLLGNDSDLDPLRSDPRFKQIVAKFSCDDGEDKAAKRKSNAAGDRLQEAIGDFDRLRGASSQDGQQWYKVGSRLLQLRDLDRATAALTEAVNHLPYRNASAMYNLACAYALKGERGAGLEWLERSINAGFDDGEKLSNDPDIAGLRSEPRFKEIEKLSRALSLASYNDTSFHDSNYSKQRWAPAIVDFEAFLRERPDNGRAWFNLGYAYHYSSEHAKAIPAFERAAQLGYRKPTSFYNIACAYSMMGNRDAALDWLEKSVEAGFDVGDYVTRDRDLDNLRSDPRFKRFADMAKDYNRDKGKDK
jgi:tetratricopeptide (TPR) repeat protein